MKTVGFIGVGIMGRAMVRNLMKAGVDVTIYTRTPAKAQELIEEGATWAESIQACVQGKDAVISIVGYPQDVEEVYFGAQGVIENAKPGALLIDSTTSSPELAKKIYEAAKARGLRALDAPVTGGEQGAIDGTMVIMVGGEKEAYEEALPLFEAMGKTVRYHGPAGNGQHCKLANQIGLAAAISGLCEAITYSRAVGLCPDAVIDTIKGGSAASRQMDKLAPLILAGDDSPSFYIKHLLKDLRLSLEGAESGGKDLPVTKHAVKAYQALSERGMEDFGTQSMIRYYE